MTIKDWHDGNVSVEEFCKEFKNKNDEQLGDIAEKWKGQNPGIAASIIIAKHERRQKILKGLLILIMALFFAGTIKWIVWYIIGVHGH